MRFETRASLEDFNRFGVWDSTAQGWHTEAGLGQASAERIATDLNAQFDERGPRSPNTVRRVEPPRRAEARVIAERWRGGEIDLWIREQDGWHGHIWFAEGCGAWWPADRLRKADDDS